MQYIEILFAVKIGNFIRFFFAQNIDCGYTLEPPRLRLGAKIRKLGIPLQTSFFFNIKVVLTGVYSWTCYPDNMIISIFKLMAILEPPHGKTNNLPRRKQRRRSASQ